MASEEISPTLRVLREIRDQLKEHDGRLANVEQGLANMQQSQAALVGEVSMVASAVLQVRDLLAARLDQRDQIANHEQRLRRLEKKVG